jgi:hypothetical protein
MIGTNLKNHWLSQGIEINPGVSMEKLSAFEAKYRVLLPADLRDYFLTADLQLPQISTPLQGHQAAHAASRKST